MSFIVYDLSIEWIAIFKYSGSEITLLICQGMSIIKTPLKPINLHLRLCLNTQGSINKTFDFVEIWVLWNFFQSWWFFYYLCWFLYISDVKNIFHLIKRKKRNIKSRSQQQAELEPIFWIFFHFLCLFRLVSLPVQLTQVSGLHIK